MTDDVKSELKRDWLKPQSVIAVFSFLCAVGMGWQMIRDHERRIAVLEGDVRETRDYVIEVRTDVKAIKQATTGKP